MNLKNNETFLTLLNNVMNLNCDEYRFWMYLQVDT